MSRQLPIRGGTREPTPTNLASLPMQIIQKIISQLRQEDRKQLRLVSRRLRETVDENITKITIHEWELDDAEVSAAPAVHLINNWKRWPALKSLMAESDFDGINIDPLSSAWPCLEELDLVGCRLGPAGGAVLARGVENWPNLRKLGLRSNIGIDPIIIALSRVVLPLLEDFTIDRNPLGVNGSAALAVAASNWPLLRGLTIDQANLGDDGLYEMLNSEFSYLDELDLANNGLTPEACKVLVRKAQNLPSLTLLNLSLNALGSAGLQELSKGNFLNLEELFLCVDSIGFDRVGLQALNIAVTKWPKLSTLGLNNSLADEEALNGLFESPLPGLKWLTLANNDISVVGAAALASAVHRNCFPSLRGLSLNYVALDETAIRALFHNPWSTLEYLNLSGEDFGDIEAQALAECAEHLPALRTLELNNFNIGLRGIQLLSRGNWASGLQIDICDFESNFFTIGPITFDGDICETSIKFDRFLDPRQAFS